MRLSEHISPCPARHPDSGPNLVDRAWQMSYRVAFPLAQACWRLRRAQPTGALVAVYFRDSLLLVRSSYRKSWNFPGGYLKCNEAPEEAAERELLEEVGVKVDTSLSPMGFLRNLSGGCSGTVHFFEICLDAAPDLRVDNREIVAAEFVPFERIANFDLTAPVSAYLKGRLGANQAVPLCA